MGGYELKSLDKPDESRGFPNGRVDVVALGGHSIGRIYLQPGWKWSEAVKPLVNTELCEVRHVGVCVSGRLGVRMSDGTEFQIQKGDAYAVTSEHDAWVEGEEPYQAIEFKTLAEYAKPS
jgi:hypothetical protein